MSHPGILCHICSFPDKVISSEIVTVKEVCKNTNSN